MSLQPIHQLVLNDSTNDVGTSPSEATVSGVSYINYEGKDCVYINSDSVNPAITIPCVVSNTSPFTLSFWMYTPYTVSWNLPIGLDDGSTGIISINTCEQTYLTPIIGNQPHYTFASLNRTGFDHYVITYENNNYIIYLNNVEVANLPFTNTFTSTRINIGGNNAFSGWNFGEQTSCVAYIRQICVFDSALTSTEVDELYTNTQGNTILATPPNPLRPTMLAMSLITYNSFTVSWSGGEGATSYTYTLNGTDVTPSVEEANSASFTGLSASTVYALIVTAVNADASDLQASQPKNVTTLPNAPTELSVSIDSVGPYSFMASWTGGAGATSYTYALNGSPATPSTQIGNSATFSGLTVLTTYTLVIRAINAGGQTSSTVTTTTLETPPFPVPSPVVFLSGSDYVSGVWTDKSGNGNSASLANGVAEVNTDGNGIVLNGNTKWTLPNLEIGNSWTLEAWYKDNGTTQGQASIITRSDPGNTSVGPVLGFMQNGSIEGAFYVLGDNWYQGTPLPLQNTMNHYAVTWDGTTMTTYVNNLEIGSVTLTGACADNGQQFYIGSDWSGGAYMIGELGEIRIYNVALTAAQISADYDESASIFAILPPNPLRPSNLLISALTQTSFTVGWSGAGATSYTYTLNGSDATPSTEGDNSATFTGLTAGTAYAVIVTAINATDSQASQPKGTTTLPNPPTQLIVYIGSISSNSFLAAWTGALGATSFTYTINGSPVTPSADNSLTDHQSQFSSLTPNTGYTLVITAINAGGQTSSTATTTTLDPPPFPVAIHQLISNNTDVGSQAVVPTIIDPNSTISYTSSQGKDCIYISSDGTTPRINIPCVFTEATPFTFSFWIKFDSVQSWNMPITINGPDINIGTGFNNNQAFTSIGNGVNTLYNQFYSGAVPDFGDWRHIAITYDNGNVLTYVNGSLSITLTLGYPFTTSQITVGGNWQYQALGLGGTDFWTGYLRQICVFESALSPEDVSTLYTLTEGNTLLGVPPNPLKPSSLSISSLTQTSFVVSWSATGATSYTYTLNSSDATPSAEGDNTATFTGLTSATSYTLVITAVNDTDSQASRPKNLTTLPNPPTSLVVSTTSITYKSFVASWTGGEGATSYTYTLNGEPATPSIQTANSASFTGLSPSTAYTLVVTAVNGGGQAIASATTTTLAPPPLPFPVNQIVLSDSSDDLGNEPGETETVGDVVFTNYAGKDCISISPSAERRCVKVPCAFTSESSFTISFWVYSNPAQLYWYCPITLGDGTNSLITFGLLNTSSLIYLGLYPNVVNNGSGEQYNATPSHIIPADWNNFTITYDNGLYSLYTNGIFTTSTQFTQSFTSTEIRIGDNSQSTSWVFTELNTTMYIRQVCVFDSSLIAEQITNLYTQTQSNIVLAPSNPLKPYSLLISSITSSSFVVSWKGGVGAVAYTYTMNGIAVSPSIDNGLTNKSATFTGLTAATSYIIIVSGVSPGAVEIQASAGKNLKTFSVPIHQLVLSDSSEDLVNSTLAVSTGNIIEYTNYAGKDCVYIVSDGLTPTINVPCVFTQASSFTFGFWINFNNVGPWCVPLSLNGANIHIMLAFSAESTYLSVGDGVSQNYIQSNIMGASEFRSWNHITVTYNNGSVSAYKNGAFAGLVEFTQAFTTSQITIGGNWKYQLIGNGGQQVWSGYLHQVCIFDNLLSVKEIYQLYTNTQGNAVLVTPPNQLKPYSIHLSNIDYTEFSLSWSCGLGATSYTFTVNGSPFTPSVEEKSATFTSLTPDTTYIVIITAVSSSDSQASFSKTVRTRKALINPIHQFVFNGVAADLANASTAITLADPTNLIEYTTYDGKDCMYINSDGSRPNIQIPYIVTNTSSFTLSYWVNMPNTGYWQIPLGLNDEIRGIVWTAILGNALYLQTGSTLLYGGATSISLGWNHIAITYSNKNLYIYINGLIRFNLSGIENFSSKEINIGGNNKYAISSVGFTEAKGYIRQLCIFDYQLNAEQISQLYVTTQGNNAFVQPNNAIIYGIIIKKYYTGFEVYWSGGEGATSYTYMLNGSPVTPTTDNGLTSKSAIFTGLTSNTSYTLVISTGEFSSSTISILTKAELSAPINQFILNDSCVDVGSEPVVGTIDTAVIYGNIYGKDCVTINSNGVTPVISIPYIVTYTNPFTLSFWVNVPYINAYTNYIGIDNGIRSIIEYATYSDTSYYIWVGSRAGSGGAASGNGVNMWNHIVLTYKDGYYFMYINNKIVSTFRYKSIFTSTRINIGGNGPVSEWLFGGQLTCVANIRQLCTFDYALNEDDVNELYTNTQSNTALAPPSVPLFPYSLTVSELDLTTFTVSWSGGEGATFYTFTLNGSTVAPSISTSNTASFIGLIPGTSYTLVVTAVSSSDSQASRPKLVITKTSLALPIHEFIFNNSEDVGIEPLVPTLIDPTNVISYTTHAGKDCVYINSDGINPRINIPCVFTESSSFTFGFWIKFDIVGGWCVPITMNSENTDITLAFVSDTMILMIGNGINSAYTSISIGDTTFTQWNHITITYTNGSFMIYRNGIFCNSIINTKEFTTSQITIGGNGKYQYALGGQNGWAGYLHHLCVFNSALNVGQVSELYIKTQYNTIITIPSNPLTPYRLQISSLITSFTLSWLGGLGATSYTYMLNGSTMTLSTDITNNSAVITGLTSDTSYTLILTAVNDDEQSSSYPIVIRTLGNAVTPLSVTTNTITTNSFVAAWTGGEGATSYIYTLNGSPATPAVNLTAKTATFTGLAGSMDYTLVITAVNSAGQTSSEPLTVSTLSDTPLPITVSIDSITYESFIASWTGGQGATSYTYTLNGTSVTPNETNGSALFASLNGATSYTLVITAVNSSGQTSSTPVIATTLDTPPTAPLVSSSAITYNSFVASWTGALRATSYTYTLNGTSATPVQTNNSATFTSLNGSTNYTLVITAVNNGGQTASESLLLITLSNPPTAPSVSTSSITYHSFVASWTGAVGATSYSYTLNGTPVTPSAQTADSATFTGLSGSSAYILVVSSINNGGETAAEPISITTLSTPPTTPVVSSSAITYNSFLASWTGGERATSYIYTLNGYIATPFTQTSNSASFAMLNASTEYTLVVSAVNNGGQTASEPVSITTLSTPPTAPIVSTSSISYNSFVASWTGALRATTYIYTLNGAVVIPPIQTSSSATFTSLNGATEYTLVITAVNEGGQAESTPVDLTTLPDPPTAPSVEVGSITYQSFVASWTGGEGATSYTYKLNGSRVVPSSQTANSAIFASLNAATNYTLVIEAINAGGKTPSESVLITTIVAPPAALSLSTNTITYQSFVASWTGGEGATSYTYKLNGSSVVPSTDNSLTNKTVIFASLNAAATYILVVSAVNDGGHVDSAPALARTLSAPPLEITVSVNTITYESFVASWVGGEGATSYRYTLNGSTATPYSETSDSASFTGLSADTSYTLIVYGITDGGETSSSPVVLTTFSTPPTVPVVSTGSMTYSSFMASWTGADRATSYSYTLNGSIMVPSEDNGLTNKSATFATLSASTEYTLVVSAVNNGGSTPSAPVQITTFRTPPTTPNISSSLITYQAFTASWTGGSGATSYSYTLNGSPATPSTDNALAGKSVTFTGLYGSTDYVLVITAVNNGGQTSSSVSITTLSEPAMALRVSTTAITYQSFVASWTGGSGATSYTYTLNGSPITPSVDNGLASNSATFSALSAATSYTLVITAVNNGGQTSSDPVVVTTFSTPPTALSLSTASITYQSFVSSWTGGLGATSYSYVLNGIPTTPSLQTSNSATFASLTPATQYTLIVRATNNGGQAVSTPVVVSTFSTPPTALSLSTGSITYQSFVASWTGGLGATSYSYTLNGSPVEPFSDNGLTAKVALFSGLTAGTSYTLIVTALNNGGQASSVPVVTTTFNTPPTAPSVSVNSITSQSFVATWTGQGATSYVYKLNGETVSPSSQTSNSATFTSLIAATSYTLVITAVNNGGQNSSDTTTITTLNQKPTAVVVSIASITYESFVASWTGGSPASSYSYTLNGLPATPVDNGLISRSATFAGLSPATGYTLVVTAVNNGGSTSSSPVLATTFSTPPTAPIVSTGSITYQSFVSSWTGADRATSYTYTLNGIATTPSTQTSNSATFAALTASTNYTLVVTAVNNGGQTSSTPVSLRILNAPPLAMVVSSSSITYNSFVASWTGGSGATSYTYKLNGSPVTPEDNGLISKNARFTALTAATSYTLIITAIDEGGETSSGPLTVTTLYETPTVPMISTSSITYQSFVASWTGGSPATSYIYKLNGVPIAAQGNGLANKTVTFTSLTASTSYTLVIVAVNNSVQTSSDAVIITTLVGPPSAPSVSTSSITYESFVASWTGSGATSYSYTLNGTAATPSAQTANSATFASLNATTSYTLVVTAVNNSGQTSSTPVTITTVSTPPTAPIVSASSITYNSFVASWTGSGAISYTYKLNGTLTTPSAQTSNSATFTSLNGTTSYSLVITAVNNGGSTLSAPLVITTLVAPPTAPILATSSITYNSFTASWTGEGATSYIYMLNGASVTPEGNGLTTKSVTFTSLNTATSYTLIVIAVNDTAQTSSSPVIIKTLSQKPSPLTVTISLITFESFLASWIGGQGATSYSYTLNGTPTPPSVQTSNSASFTPLTHSTSYTLVITATNDGGSTSSTPVIITTLALQTFPLPIHQLVLNDSCDDTGTSYVDVVATDPEGKISYTNNGEKDCVHIVSDGTIPTINFPCVFTESSSFTFSVWVKFDSIDAWGVPITLNGANINISIGFSANSLYVAVGNGVATPYVQNNIMQGSDFKQWNNITFVYKNGTIKVYKNGAPGGVVNFTQAFSISQITIGGNYKYQSIGLGGQAIWDGYLRQLCIFDSVLNGNDIIRLYTKTADNTVLGSALPKVTKLKESFVNTTTVQSATSAINAALTANSSLVTVVTAALATVSPTMFTALVTNPVFVGTTVSIPPTVASVLYASFEDKSTLDASLPFKINFPAADGSVTAPTTTSNAKLAIDLSVDTYVSFKGCAGYGIHVIGGDQYFTTPSNPLGTLVRVGDIITFTTDAGETIVSKVADLDIVLIPYTPPAVICFLGSAPVLTPNGYSRIDSLVVGDIICTREGETTAVIEKVERQVYMPGRDTNPYIIPAGRFGSNGRILISPRHKVAVDGQMIEARFLGLEQEEQYEKITYYNLQVTRSENIIVAGLEVESLQALTRVNIPMDTFNYIVANKYDGKMSDEIKAGCHLMADGSMSVPMIV